MIYLYFMYKQGVEPRRPVIQESDDDIPFQAPRQEEVSPNRRMSRPQIQLETSEEEDI